jgi:hypothetical protein
LTLINNLSIDYHQYCSSSYLDYPFIGAPSPPAIEIKLELDSEKALKAAVAISAAYGLCHVSEGTKSPQLATANALALIAIVAILYGPCLFPKNPPEQA